MSTLIGCIRFRNDAPVDAGFDAGGAADVEVEASTPIEGGDVVVIPPPVCQRFTHVVAESIASDLIALLQIDCRLRNHFTGLPPLALRSFQECLTAQIGQVMGCRHLDGEPFRYPTRNSTGHDCHDMKSSHARLASSDGDFDAFVADLGEALVKNGLDEEEKTRVVTVFMATRNDIVRIKDAGPTMACDASDAAPDASPDAN